MSSEHPASSRKWWRNPVHALLLIGALPCSAQELEPRRWSHLPTGMNFGGIAYAYTTGDIAFNPVLRIQDATVEMHTIGMKYIRTFELFGKSARFDLIQAYQSGEWNGLLSGAPASVERNGLSDTSLRFAINLLGAPPLEGGEFAAYRAATDCETILGVGLVVRMPTGDYKKDKLINLGDNRFTIRPQIGVIHNRGKWSLETTGAVWIYTDNDSFFNGNRLEQDPLFSVQGHIVYTFRPGLWLGVGVGYGFGSESRVNDASSHDRMGNLLWEVALGIPINRQWGAKISYIGSRSTKWTGADTDTISVALSLMW